MLKRFFIRRRYARHIKYVSVRMAHLQMELCHEAIETGKVNLEKRKQLLKYKTHIQYL